MTSLGHIMMLTRWLVRSLLGFIAFTFIALTAGLTLTPSLDDWPIAPPAKSPSHGQVSLTYLGTSTILISDGETQLLTDGFFSRPSIFQLMGDISPSEARIDAALTQANISSVAAIPVLHSHFDHAMDSGIVALKTGAQLMGSQSTAMVGIGSGLPESRITTVQTHHPYTFGKFTLYFVPAGHVPLPRFIEELTGKGEIHEPVVPPAPIGAWQEGQSYGLVVTHPAGTLLIQGSAGMQPGELDRYRADYALLASASLGKQGKQYQQDFVDETAGAVGAHTIIPVHWDDFFSELTPDVAPLPWLLDHMPNSFKALTDHFDGDFFVIKPFVPFTLTPRDSTRPAEPAMRAPAASSPAPAPSPQGSSDA